MASASDSGVSVGKDVPITEDPPVRNAGAVEPLNGSSRCAHPVGARGLDLRSEVDGFVLAFLVDILGLVEGDRASKDVKRVGLEDPDLELVQLVSQGQVSESWQGAIVDREGLRIVEVVEVGDGDRRVVAEQGGEFGVWVFHRDVLRVTGYAGSSVVLV